MITPAERALLFSLRDFQRTGTNIMTISRRDIATMVAPRVKTATNLIIISFQPPETVVFRSGGQETIVPRKRVLDILIPFFETGTKLLISTTSISVR